MSPAPEAADRADAAKNLTRMAERSARLVALLTPETASAVPDAELLARINLGVEGGYAQLPAPLDAANLRAVRFGPTKLSRVSLALTHLNISGYYFPWTGEAHINEAMPRSEWARVAAHERAHQRGFARENEATVMGVLACLASGDPEVRYSGALGLFVSFDRDVARIGAEARKALWVLLPAGAADDLRAESAFWKAHEGAPARVSEKVNDTYLKAQGVTTGVASYSETTRLFLQAMETEGIAATSHEAASAFEWEAARPRR